VALVVVLWSTASVAEPAGNFPRPTELEPDVRFWTRVYTEIDTNSGFIHDDQYMDVVYETLRFPERISSRKRRRQVKSVKQRYRNVLRALGSGKREGLSDQERRVLALWPDDVSNRTLRAAAGRLRFQLGQSDKFRAGLIRSGAWESHIRRTLRDMSLPVELVALPHVESSYNPKARSHVGAAGLWQFTRSTGRRYMRVDRTVDERMDPFISTKAAARLLGHNHSVTGTWPLAITAYNHGAAGMRRAARKLGTHDIATVVRRYKSRRFGFASRNFYVAFLAAVEVHFNASKYFGELHRHGVEERHLVRVPDYVKVDTLERVLGIDREALRAVNPALRPSVWRGNKFVPRGFALRIPAHLVDDSMEQALAEIAPDDRFAAQQPETFYKVRRGNTLTGIATRFEVSVDDLMAANDLRSPHRIRAGQVLRLPLPQGAAGAQTVASAPSASVTPEPPAEISKVALAAVTPGESFAPSPSEDMAARSTQGTPAATQVETVGVEVLAMESGDAEPVSDTVIARVEQSEPASAEEADHLAPAMPPGAHPELTADPSDYSVAGDRSIEVQAAETLGHYADWLEVRAWRLRHLNGMSFRKPVVIGSRLDLDLSQVDAEAFEHKRIDYHRSLQESFFTRYRITGTSEHVVKRGESLWELSKRRYRIPIWLLRQYNPDLDIDTLSPGVVVKIPALEAIEDGEPVGETASTKQSSIADYAVTASLPRTVQSPSRNRSR
jgi:membrane-bound lytic murein transglycosylase D